MRQTNSDSQRTLDRIRNLRPGEHLCTIQENRPDIISAATAFIRGGLDRGECLYVIDPNDKPALVTALRAQGIDVDAVRSSGMLTLFDKGRYLPNGRFVPDEMIRFLTESYRFAITKFSGFRLTGEMTWVLGGDPGTERLIEYEAKLNDFLRGKKTSILCQYLRRKFPAEILLNVLRTHPLVVHRQVITENPYYIPPREFLNGSAEKILFEHYLKALDDYAANREALRNLSLQLLRSQDEERRRVARELHDSTGQILTGLVMRLASLLKSKTRMSAGVHKELMMSLRLAKQASKEINNISYLLHPPMLDEFGLSDALRWYVRGFSKRSGIDVKLTLGDDLDRLPKEIELPVFRIVQEGLNNICRHSGSKRAQIDIDTKDKYLIIKVQDFGHGLKEHSQPVDTIGIGIAGIRERLQQLGGDLVLRSSSGGTLLRGTIPVERIAT